MSRDKDGGPAFTIYSANRLASGMKLRDYFAAQAMQGIISGYEATERYRNPGDDPQGIHADLLAEEAYRIADAMLKAGERREGS